MVILQGWSVSGLSGILTPSADVVSQVGVGRYLRLAMMAAMLSVGFERFQGLLVTPEDARFKAGLLVVGILISLCMVLTEKYSRAAIILFILLLGPYVSDRWATFANHGWLSVWAIPVAALFAKWWEQPAYADYLRLTLGVVMIAAACQKLLAGTYLDGSYIAYLSYYGSTTENMFRFLCSEETLTNPCGWHKLLGTFIVLWQIGVGLLLLAGLRSLLFLFVEVAFLLGAGLYADEMNFQVLNIALLCIAFRVGMSYGLFLICGGLLVIDLHGISRFINYVF